MGGASSQLAKGQPEAYRIQNASPLYQSEEWLRRRIEIFQDNLLATRIENMNLKAKLRELSVHPAQSTVSAESTRHETNTAKTGAQRLLPKTIARTLSNLIHSLKSRSRA
jgi:hypothetical protein